MRASLFAIAVAGVTALGFVSPGRAQESADQKLGTVHFETSCNETAQRRFDRAMRYQHSFWYTASREIYEETLKADPGCAIAYWGIALSYLNNPHSPIPAPNLPLGLGAIEKAKAAGAKTERERDYIDALSVMYVDYEKVPHQARVQSYLKAMETLAGRYPADDEAQIFYAIALNVAASPSDKTYANQLKGAAILGPILERQPQHPGVAHYLIHLYDYPPIAANLASVQAAKASKELGDQMHGQDYLVYAYLQLGQDKEALGVVTEIEALRPDADAFAAAFSQAAAPARYMVERGDWNGAANLEVRPSKFPHAMAITHFARAVGAARTGKIDAAKVDTAKLAELRDRLREAKNGYWAGQVDVQEQVATAWVLYASGNHDEALKAMSAAVSAEDNTEKAPVTPGPLAPARELYGAMLLDRGMAKEALAVFEATMAKEPNRYNGYVGAAMAAQAAGDAAKAKATYGKLIALAAESSSERPTLAAARSFVARN